MDNVIKSWLYACAPREVDSTETGTSGTYQAAAAEYEALHVLTCPYALRIIEGTGSSVTATSGLMWPANTPYTFIPVEDHESIGFATLNGSDTFSSTSPCTVAVIERKR